MTFRWIEKRQLTHWKMIPPQLFCDSREVTQLSCRTSLLVYTIISGTIRSLRNSKVSLSSLQLPNLDLIEGQSKSTRLRLNTLLTLCVKYKEVYSGYPSELHRLLYNKNWMYLKVVIAFICNCVLFWVICTIFKNVYLFVHQQLQLITTVGI